jgi:D-3-phosphoglycerate dehydrogenase
MRVLIADEFPGAELAALRQLGLDVQFRPKARGAELIEAAREASILIVRSTEVPAAVFESAVALTLVIRAGAGVNTIDVQAASGRGVYVANCPGQNAIAVAELAWGLILAIDRRIPDNVIALREGRWLKKEFSEAKGLHDRTLGVVGLGSIGTEVARRASAFGMRTLGWSRNLSPMKARALGIEPMSDLTSLARRSDILTVHVPGNRETKGLVSRDVLAAMPDGGVVVNTSRADVVDQAALLAELERERLWAASDVFEGEPKAGEDAFDPPLAKSKHFYGTHHIGASTEQAQNAIARETVRIVESFLRTGVVPNCVNVAKKTPAHWQLIVRHYDRVGVLANVLGVIREAGINAQEIENTIFDGAAAACCKIQLDARPGDDVLARIRERSEEIIFVDLIELRD